MVLNVRLMWCRHAYNQRWLCIRGNCDEKVSTFMPIEPDTLRSLMLYGGSRPRTYIKANNYCGSRFFAAISVVLRGVANGSVKCGFYIRYGMNHAL